MHLHEKNGLTENPVFQIKTHWNKKFVVGDRGVIF